MSEPASLEDRVVFVLGTSRSGSTMLASALASVNGFVNVGETWKLWKSWDEPKPKCGCGLRLRECEFWASVIDELGVVPADLAKLAWDSAAYRRAMNNTYQAVLRRTGADYVVDTSKYPHYLRALYGPRAQSGVVHIVRDPRGVLTSQQRGFENRERIVPPAPSVALLTRVTAHWQRRNFAAAVRARRARRSVRVRYEDFVARPAEVLADVVRVVAPSLRSGIRMPIVPGLQHVAAGNPSRYQQGPLTFREDDTWRSSIPSSKRVFAFAVGLPQTARFHYPVR